MPPETTNIGPIDHSFYAEIVVCLCNMHNMIEQQISVLAGGPGTGDMLIARTKIEEAQDRIDRTRLAHSAETYKMMSPESIYSQELVLLRAIAQERGSIDDWNNRPETPETPDDEEEGDFEDQPELIQERVSFEDFKQILTAEKEEGRARHTKVWDPLPDDEQ